MTGPTPDEPGLHVVPDPDDAVVPPSSGNDPADPAEVADEDVHGDPLLTRAQRIAELPLDERPAAFDGLNRALVAELQTLEEG